MAYLLLLLLLASAASAAETARQPPRATYTKATFIPPAAPTLASPPKPLTKSGWPSAGDRMQQRIIATGYGTYSSASFLAKKKKGGEGGGGTATQPVSKKGKIQVVLLQPVPNVGQKGDVVFVSSAVFQNQLQRSKKARLIGEEEVRKMEEEREAQERELAENARRTKGMLEEAMVANLGGEDQCPDDGDICGVALEMRRKAGPEGNLFGGVNPKMVMDALQEKYPEGSWDGKQIKVTEVKDMEGKDVKKKDIKHTGDYSVSVALGKGVDVAFILSIVAE
ncbi:hypothetical protein ACHAWF_018656 [Thalassiosira exigua]